MSNAISKKKYTEIMKKNPTDFNNYMQQLKDFKEAEKLLIFMLKSCEKNKNRSRIQRLYHRMSVLRRMFEYEMINDRRWYDKAK